MDDVPFLWLDTESDFHHLVRHVVHAGQYLKQAKPPFFNFVVMARYGAHRITINNYVLHRPLKDLNLVNCNKAPYIDSAANHWATTLTVDKLCCKHQKFARAVYNDGTIICVHFLRIKKPMDDVPLVAAVPVMWSALADTSSDCIVHGNAPRRTNIF